MTTGLETIDGNLTIDSVLERLMEMRPPCISVPFDADFDQEESIDWGKNAQAEFERGVYNKYINELTALKKKLAIEKEQAARAAQVEVLPKKKLSLLQRLFK